MTRRTHALALVTLRYSNDSPLCPAAYNRESLLYLTLVLMFLMVAPEVFAAEADADRWLAGIDDVNGDAVADIAMGDPAQGLTGHAGRHESRPGGH
jgi:hypothetical protein